MPSRLLSRALMPAAVVALLAACSSTPAPSGEMAVAQKSVDTAAATPSVVQAAPVELQRARDKLARAQRAMTDRNYDEARRLAQEADVDATLALAKANASRSEQAAAQLKDSVRQLQGEIQRQQQQTQQPQQPQQPR